MTQSVRTSTLETPNQSRNPGLRDETPSVFWGGSHRWTNSPKPPFVEVSSRIAQRQTSRKVDSNFLELRKSEVQLRRISLPRTRVNKRYGPGFSNVLPIEIMTPLSTAGTP